jgi:hypothetical protein
MSGKHLPSMNNLEAFHHRRAAARDIVVVYRPSGRNVNGYALSGVVDHDTKGEPTGIPVCSAAKG